LSGNFLRLSLEIDQTVISEKCAESPLESNESSEILSKQRGALSIQHYRGKNVIHKIRRILLKTMNSAMEQQF
jgi:hypothetical protein